MTKEFILKRIEGKEKEVAKLEKKLARIEQAKATNWEVNPYFYHEDDIKWTTRDLESARKSLEEYRAKLQSETEKDNSRNIPAILEFLEQWKKRVYAFYQEGLEALDDEEKAVNKLYKEYSNLDRTKFDSFDSYYEERERLEAIYKVASNELHNKKYGTYERRTFERYGRKWSERVKIETGKFEWLAVYFEYSLEEALQRLQKELDEEAKRKYDFIIERTNKITGTITDATSLRVGAQGDLNGFIIGERGTAKVTTIGAGGYNIQCYHFRTLIHKEK